MSTQISTEPYSTTKSAIYMRNYRHGISQEQFEEMWNRQDGKCALCDGAPDPTGFHGINGLKIDHDHATGRVRGLLCGTCNRGLGNFEDRIDLLEKAISYLRDQND